MSTRLDGNNTDTYLRLALYSTAPLQAGWILGLDVLAVEELTIGATLFLAGGLVGATLMAAVGVAGVIYIGVNAFKSRVEPEQLCAMDKSFVVLDTLFIVGAGLNGAWGLASKAGAVGKFVSVLSEGSKVGSGLYMLHQGMDSSRYCACDAISSPYSNLETYHGEINGSSYSPLDNRVIYLDAQPLLPYERLGKYDFAERNDLPRYRVTDEDFSAKLGEMSNSQGGQMYLFD